MPANKNVLTRIALLDKLLSDRYHNYSIQDMTDYLEVHLPEYRAKGGVTKRCVEKDIAYLRDNSPFEVEFEVYKVDAYSATADKPYKKRCIRYADPTFSIFKSKLTDEEKGILSTALSTLGSFDGLQNFGWLDDLSKRLGLEEEATIIQISKNISENSTLLAEAFGAIKAKSVIRLHYSTFKNETIREVIVSPYLLREYNKRWYLIGAAQDTNRILNFALDRITQIEILGAYPYHAMPEDVLDRYEDIIGITYIESNPNEKILFWVSEDSKSYVESKPLHGSQICFRASV